MFRPALPAMGRHTGTGDGAWGWRGDAPDGQGGLIVYSDARRYRHLSQTLRVLQRYEWFDASGALVSTHVRDLRLAWLHPSDLRELLRDAGFVEIEIDGGFDGEALEAGGEQVVRARRPLA